jgi:hypothetical protein
MQFILLNPKECKPTYKGDTCTPMLIAALVTTAKLWNQPRYSVTNEWIKKCDIHAHYIYMCICMYITLHIFYI